MDPEENNLKQEGVDSELKNSVSEELSSYMSPYSKPNNVPTPLSDGATFLFKGQNMDSIDGTGDPDKKPQQQPIIRTFKGDVEETIQANHLSSINIAVAENKKMLERAQFAEEEQKTKKKNYTILIVSLLLVFGGISAFVIPYLLVNKQNEEEIVEVSSSPEIIVPDLQEKINLDDLAIGRLPFTLSERIDQSNTKLGDIKSFHLTEGRNQEEKAVESKKFISLLGMKIPSEIERTLRSEYMFGMHNFNGNQRFLILKVGSYETVFSGMLNWELDLWNDFQKIFALPAVSQGDGLSDRFSGVLSAKFQDAIYGNKDSRVVKDPSGNVMFLYSIIDKNTVVITTSPDTLKEIINRNKKAQTTVQ